jgi:hypothetical protein
MATECRVGILQTPIHGRHGEFKTINFQLLLKQQ